MEEKAWTLDFFFLVLQYLKPQSASLNENVMLTFILKVL